MYASEYNSVIIHDPFPPETPPYYMQFKSPDSKLDGVECLYFHGPDEIKREFLHCDMIGHFITPSTYNTELKNINSYMLLYTLSGEGKLEYLNNTYELTPQSGFFIDCRNLFHYYNSSNEKWEFFFIYLNGEAVYKYFIYFFRINGPMFIQSLNSNFLKLFYSLLQIYKQNIPHKQVVVSRLLTDIIAEIIVNGKSDYSVNISIPLWVVDMRLYIEKYFQYKISLDALSKKYCISKSHLSREFKKFTGYSPIEYRIKIQMNYAKNLLVCSGLSVEEIAYNCGMNNTNYFIQLFKKHTLLTPLMYRKSKDAGR